jgi:ATP synthase F1 delta subunit
VNSAHNRALARRYAQAFLNVYGSELTPAIRGRLRELHRFLSMQNSILFFLTIPTIDDEVKLRGLAFLCEKFELPDSVKKSMFLLLASKRAILLEQMVGFIDILYNKEHAISSFSISSACPLSHTDKEFLVSFLKAHTGDDVLYTYVIDKSLIAGIRMCSDTHLWEHSIARQLREIQLLLVR